jgi:hypothetical protein
MTYECAREQDVLDALSAARWPDRCDEDLQTHVRGCAICRDLADAAAALLDDRDAASNGARLPPSGVVWWRAQLRGREEAARAAARPLAFIQGVAASAAVSIAVAVFRAIPGEYVREWRTWIGAVLPSVPLPDFSHVAAALPLAVVVIVAMWLLVAPLATLLTITDD